MICRFAKRCENFYPDQDNPSNCLLLCQKNPLALAIALMPDRYIEKNVRLNEPERKIVNMTKDVPKKPTRKEQLDDDYEELVSATQELDNEVIEFEFDPEADIADKLQSAPQDDLSKLIEKTEKNRNAREIDPEISQAIIDNTQDNEEPVLHPLDEINFELEERVSVADQPQEPQNAEIYIKKRDRGRPPMTDEEKEESRIRREEEKKIEQQKKDEDAIKRRDAMKKKIKKKKTTKKSKKAKSKKN